MEGGKNLDSVVVRPQKTLLLWGKRNKRILGVFFKLERCDKHCEVNARKKKGPVPIEGGHKTPM